MKIVKDGVTYEVTIIADRTVESVARYDLNVFTSDSSMVKMSLLNLLIIRPVGVATVDVQ